jgi:hypothetical protein
VLHGADLQQCIADQVLPSHLQDQIPAAALGWVTRPTHDMAVTPAPTQSHASFAGNHNHEFCRRQTHKHSMKGQEGGNGARALCASEYAPKQGATNLGPHLVVGVQLQQLRFRARIQHIRCTCIYVCQCRSDGVRVRHASGHE